ncbi:hypothetical protein PIB30_020231 [Stylosanthes scabra]|uniref:HMA domain-containing protein n=1 Tax=Stylosanthes scabra TaxID=79078 RepID=A0ABU6T994_9FABA|nr:hypothetical protein [Stylosanthes scabra]
MDSKPPLKYQTWFLKVSIHCDGCRRKVKKVLQSIDGVFTTKIDQQEQKVTVTGIVTVETLLRKLLRAGKHAEIWPENISVKENNNNNNKSNKEKLEKKNHSSDESSNNNNYKSEKTSQNCNQVMNKSSNTKSPEKSPSGDQSGGGGSATKKKKKGPSDVSVHTGSEGAPAPSPADTGFGQEMGRMNLIPTRQQQETSYHPPMVYGGAYYSRLYPMGGPSYYVPPYNIMCTGLDQEYSYQIQSRPLVSFEIFSDENANGCSIM